MSTDRSALDLWFQVGVGREGWTSLHRAPREGCMGGSTPSMPVVASHGAPSACVRLPRD